MGERTLAAPRAGSSGVGHSHLADSERAGRDAVHAALAGHMPTAQDLVVLFTTVDHDTDALYAAALAEAAPAGVVGCTSTGNFTHAEQVPSGCVAALLSAQDRSFGVCHVERDDGDIAGSARAAAQTARDLAGDEPGCGVRRFASRAASCTSPMPPSQ